jgi:hypothetical protein
MSDRRFQEFDPGAWQEDGLVVTGHAKQTRRMLSPITKALKAVTLAATVATISVSVLGRPTNFVAVDVHESGSQGGEVDPSYWTYLHKVLRDASPLVESEFDDIDPIV